MSESNSKPSVNIRANEGTGLEAVVAITVGNTRTQVGSFIRGESVFVGAFGSTETDEIVRTIKERIIAFGGALEPVVVIGGVDQGAIEAIESSFAGGAIYRLGRDIGLKVQHTLTDSGEQTVGQDRLLCAIGAFHLYKQACVIVDAGTAITIDFIDGAGVFHGGAIMPGVSMMLESMHEKTASLPEVAFKRIDASSNEPGKQTDDAMRLGVSAAACGAVRLLTERYAEFFEGYPKVVATGGDMGIFEGDDLVEMFVPDLQLVGLRVACEMEISSDDDEQ